MLGGCFLETLTATVTTTTPVYYSFACFISTSVWIVFCHGNSTDITEWDNTHSPESGRSISCAPFLGKFCLTGEWEKAKYIFFLFLGRSTSFWLGNTLIFDAEEMLHHNRKPCLQSVLCLFGIVHLWCHSSVFKNWLFNPDSPCFFSLGNGSTHPAI